MTTASPERARQIAELAKAAAECETKERSRFVAESCGADAELCAEVNSLLRFHDAGDGVFDKGALHLVAGTFDAGPAIEAGQQVGDYRIVSHLGAGGMGDVYLAEDLELRRKVALKLVRTGIASDDIVTRFRHEEQILASLNHPNIAQLHGYGRTQSGTPFFVMEYVEGAPLTDFCNASKLSISDRLQLFQKVCAAVHYAHQHLVIHRDLKPSNILVTEAGEPKLLDFGIAKLIEGEDSPVTRAVTMTMFAMMTPEYASPEQVRGEPISTATDIYSLGVILYELLTNQRPYRTQSRRPDEIARAVTEQEPLRPSTAAAASELRANDVKRLRGDLDNIVLMALRKEPARRYSSVAQFSDDIRRYLAGRPVVAHRDTVAYRAKKFVRRNRAGVAAAAVLLVAIIAGSIATAWQARVATRERDRAQRRFADVRQLSNALLFDIAPKIERIAGATEARKALVSRALEYLDSLARESAGDPQLQSELAAAYEKIGELQGSPRKPNLNDFTGAMRSYEKAREVRSRLFAESGDRMQLRHVAADSSALGALHWFRSDLKDALAASQAALDAYALLLAGDPASRELRLRNAETQIDLARTHYYNEDNKRVYPLLGAAIATLEELNAADGSAEDTEIRRLLARAHTLRGITLSWDSKQAEGEAEMRRALEIGEALAAQLPHDSIVRQGLIETKFQAAQLYEDMDNTRAFEFSLEALRLTEEAIATDPADVQAQQNRAKAHSMLGQIAIQLKKPDEAIEYLTRSADAFAELERSDPTQRTYKHDQGRVLMMLGTARQARNEIALALDTYDRALALFADLQAVDPGNNFHVRKLEQLYSYKGDAYRALADAAGAQERQHLVSRARENYQRALDILRQLESQHLLSDYDRKELEKVETALATL